MGENANFTCNSDQHKPRGAAPANNGTQLSLDPTSPRQNGQKYFSEEPNFQQVINHVTNVIFLFIIHLSGRADRSIGGIELDHPDKFGRKLNLIDAVCQNTWSTTHDRSQCERAAILFKAHDKLSQVAAPATGMTIAYTLLVAPQDEAATEDKKTHEPISCGYPHDFAKKAYPHLAESARRCRKWIDWLPMLMVIALIMTSLLSWYVGYGKFILLRIEQLDAQRTEIARALDLAEKQQPATTTSDKPARGTSSEAWLQDEQHLAQRCPLNDANGNSQASTAAQPACMAVEQLKGKRRAADEALTEWTTYAIWLPDTAAWFAAMVGGPIPKPIDDPPTAPEREEQWAANLLSVLGNYVLPMMYGFLGAAAAAIMNLKQKIRSCRLSPRDRRMNHVQLVLGVMTGACIGLFLTASGVGSSGAPLSGTSVPLSASALSFLAGFGVEGVFKMLENIMITVFGGKPNETAPQPHH